MLDHALCLRVCVKIYEDRRAMMQRVVTTILSGYHYLASRDFPFTPWVSVDIEPVTFSVDTETQAECRWLVCLSIKCLTVPLYRFGTGLESRANCFC